MRRSRRTASCGACLRFCRDRIRRPEFLRCRLGLRDNFPNGSATNEFPQNSSPESPLADSAFEAHAIHGCDVYAVRDGMAALDGAPGIQLRRAEFCFLVRMPANARGIKNHLRAAERSCREPSGYHWSQQICTPMRPYFVSKLGNPRSPGVK